MFSLLLRAESVIGIQCQSDWRSVESANGRVMTGGRLAYPYLEILIYLEYYRSPIYYSGQLSDVKIGIHVRLVYHYSLDIEH